MGGYSVEPKNIKGENGGRYITDTATYAGDFDTVLVHEAAVANIVTSNILGTLTAVVLPVGMAWFGGITSITLASGKVTVYNRVQ